MKISVTVRPGAKEDAAIRAGDGLFRVRVKAPSKEGRANEAVISVLSKYFGLPKSRISIKRGRSGKRKLVEII